MHYSIGIVSGLILSSASFGVGALAVVESRTGERVIRSETPLEYQAERTLGSGREYHPQIEDPALRTLKQIESLKQEISDLRGLVETQEHAIETLKKSQQDLYLDLEKRLSVLQQAHATHKAKPAVETPQALNSKPTSELAPKKSASTLPVHASEAVGSAPEASEISAAPSTESLSANITSVVKQGMAVTEKEAYESAYNLVRLKQYAEAVAAFQNYLVQFKAGEYAANAHYWLGEIYMTQWNADKTSMEKLDKAVVAFSNLTTLFPKHPKAADALLKLGLIESEKGNIESAKKYFSQVKNRFPGSAAARIAAARIKQ